MSCYPDLKYGDNLDLMIDGLKSIWGNAIRTYEKVVTESRLNFESFTAAIVAW
jgi:hypothetical protein